MGHLLSGEGIYPLPKNLKGIETLPFPKVPKEVKQMLGHTSYYQKFILVFSYLIWSLTQVTREAVPVIWTEYYQKQFEILKQTSLICSILAYPDPNKAYTMFPDTSRSAWLPVLTQAHTMDLLGNLPHIITL